MAAIKAHSLISLSLFYPGGAGSQPRITSHTEDVLLRAAEKLLSMSPPSLTLSNTGVMWGYSWEPLVMFSLRVATVPRPPRCRLLFMILRPYTLARW